LRQPAQSERVVERADMRLTFEATMGKTTARRDIRFSVK
jgi:hypothetical protein